LEIERSFGDIDHFHSRHKPVDAGRYRAQVVVSISCGVSNISKIRGAVPANPS
jgi:hypothetical protein